jgi:hypothetical protein
LLGFLDKSKNTIQQDIYDLCTSSKDPLISILLVEKTQESKPTDKKGTMTQTSKTTVGLLFKVFFENNNEIKETEFILFVVYCLFFIFYFLFLPFLFVYLETIGRIDVYSHSNNTNLCSLY